MNVDAITSVSPWPVGCTMPAVITVRGGFSSGPPRTISGMRRPFQDQRNCMIASVALPPAT
ncbi:hypothetical protein CFK41_14430 [Brachybacterium ginsengisoli]|uniref:Uncharacterized protein n=1 Tax=Brachybacterium ginsengisoli TaxID=1331682 RepID=A0A291H030_9MICO|nr:hypothetical protein CFK41_14430 [Brachybacterium ginsengisoli]